MPKYCVTAHITTEVSMIVEANSEEEAREIAGIFDLPHWEVQNYTFDEESDWQIDQIEEEE